MEGNLAINWKKVWTAYETVTDLVAAFIICIGSAALETHNGLAFKSEYEKNEIDIVLRLSEEYCVGT